MDNFNILISTMRVQATNSFARPMFKFTLLMNPFLNTILIMEMFKKKLGESITGIVVFGVILATLWSCLCFSSIGDINRERWSGTLPLLFITPIHINILLGAKFLGNLFLSLISSVISISTALFIFRIKMEIFHPFYLLFSLFLLVISFTIISMIFAYFLLLSRKTTLYMNLLDLPITALCGFLFPTSYLPRILQSLGDLLLPTWAVREMHISLQKNIGQIEWLSNLKGFTILLFISLLLVLGLWKIVQKRVYITGSLEVS